MKVIIAVLVVIVLAGGGALLIGHHGNSSKSPSNNTDHMPMSSSSSSDSSKSNSSQSSTSTANAITISNFAFSPASLTVKKGTTVTWTNQDSVAHTVSETDGQTGPSSSSLDKGKSYSFTYNTAGNFKYNCSIHPNMLGTVTVTD